MTYIDYAGKSLSHLETAINHGRSTNESMGEYCRQMALIYALLEIAQQINMISK
jgi:hypothetical protein